jgi:hypothetical protein
MHAQRGPAAVIERRSLGPLNWTRSDLIREKTIEVGIASLTLVLFLKFEFEKEARNELMGFEISKKKEQSQHYFVTLCISWPCGL